MSQEYDELHLPKKTMSHPIDTVEWIQQQLGIVNGEQGFDKFFLMANLISKLVLEIQALADQGLLKPRSFRSQIKINLDNESIEKMNLIWQNGLYIIVQRGIYNPNKVLSRLVFYKPQKLKIGQEQIKYPALQNMNPSGQIKQERWGVRIKEPIPAKIAFEGLDYAQVVLQGGYHWKYADRTVPMFNSQEEMDTSDANVYVIGRPAFHKIVKIEEYFFMKNWAKVFARIHATLQDIRFGGMGEEGNVRVPTRTLTA